MPRAFSAAPALTLSPAPAAVPVDANRDPGDSPALLRAQGLYGVGPGHLAPAVASTGANVPVQTQATTILAFKFAEGVLVAGDRRATAGNIIVYDRADKVLEIDRHSIMAIAGVPATAWEMARVLQHSFQYYRRTQLQEMSVSGKVRALSKLLRDNIGLVLQGIGAVVPIFATYEFGTNESGRLYFYDVMGANFEVTEYAATGSGSPGVRGVLYYENTYGEKPISEYVREEAISLAMRALDTASESDSATGGVHRDGRIYPIIKIITREGIETIADDTLARLFKNGAKHPAALGGGTPQGG